MIVADTGDSRPCLVNQGGYNARPETYVCGRVVSQDCLWNPTNRQDDYRMT